MKGRTAALLVAWAIEACQPAANAPPPHFFPRELPPSPSECVEPPRPVCAADVTYAAEIGCWDRQAETPDPDDSAKARLELSVCLAKSGYFGRAQAHAKLAVVLAERAKDDASLAAAHAELATLQTHYGKVRILVPPETARGGWEVQIDDRRLDDAELGAPVTALTGSHRIIATRSREPRTERVVDVCVTGGVDPVVVALEPGVDHRCVVRLPSHRPDDERCPMPPPPQTFCPTRGEHAPDPPTMLAMARCTVFVPDEAYGWATRARDKGDRAVAAAATELLTHLDRYYAGVRLETAAAGEVAIRPYLSRSAERTFPKGAKEMRTLPGLNEMRIYGSAPLTPRFEGAMTSCLRPGETRTVRVPTFE